MTIDTVLARVTTSPSAAPVEVVTPIKPSEAIRLGCLIAPVQVFGTFAEGAGTACALGAMAYGWGWDGIRSSGNRATHPIERALDVAFIPRDCPEGDGDVSIPHLNDVHHWSRERIADYLEGLGL